MGGQRASVYDPWVKQLLAGVDGAKVVQQMRAHYTEAAKETARKRNEDPSAAKYNDCTLRTKVSDVKKRVLNAKPGKGERNTHPEYNGDVRRLRDAAKRASAGCQKCVERFLGMGLSEQEREVRYYDNPCGREDGLCFDDSGVRDVFVKMRVLPETLKTFAVDQRESTRCVLKSRQQLKYKETITLTNVDELVAAAINILKEPSKAIAAGNINELVSALLFVSGRRTTEIMNGKSTFQALPGSSRQHVCVFQGQLKSKRDFAYKIPLLVTFKQFKRGLNALRNWQRSKHPDFAELDNKEVSMRYQPNLQRHLTQNDFLGVPGVRVRPHMLRGAYVRIVLSAFDWGQMRDKLVASYILGHANEKNADYYDHVKVEEKFKLELGKMPLTMQELQEADADFSPPTSRGRRGG
jgi:hypothetical protein